MHTLPPFWANACRLSGRLDLSQLISSNEDLGFLETASLSRLTECGIPPRYAKRLTGGVPLLSAAPFITLTDSDYPAALRCIPFAPPVLFYRGNLSLTERPTISIVGARRCTHLGSRFAKHLAGEVQRKGGVVVSGFADGIDTAAHAGSVPNTIGVLGHGLAHPLSGRRSRAAEHLLHAGGLLLSEFPNDYPPGRHTFPLRNRIIAGLSGATVVVEAGHRSGALITARQALEQGSAVYAVPGHPLMDTHAGCLKLIEQGATILFSADDLAHLLPKHGDQTERNPAGQHAALLEQIGHGLNFDQIQAQTNLSVVALTRILRALEMTGHLERLPGDRYARIIP